MKKTLVFACTLLVISSNFVRAQTRASVIPSGKKFIIQSAMNYGRNNGGYWDIPGDPTHIQKGSNIQVWNLNNGVDRKYTLLCSSHSGFYEIFVGNTRNSRVDIAGENSKIWDQCWSLG